jgi:hypothetical protein
MAADELALVRERNKTGKRCKEEDDATAKIKQWRDRLRSKRRSPFYKPERARSWAGV